MIYAITTIRENGKSRCVGYFNSYDNAATAVSNNEYDIAEMGYYKYCVIQQIQEGIYNINRTDKWFEWDTDSEAYIEIYKPEKFKMCICFGIG